MRLATSVDQGGNSARAWGKARLVAVADVTDGAIADWHVHAVGWDELYGTGAHGSHHARIAAFLREHDIDMVVAPHVGDGMLRMLTTMGISLGSATPGDAQTSVLQAAENAENASS